MIRFWRLSRVLIVGLLYPAIGCDSVTVRDACTRDGDCGDDAVCLHDDACAPRAVAERRGFELGDECVVTGGREVGCDAATEICRMGVCQGPRPDASRHPDGGSATGDGGTTTGDGNTASGACTDGSAANLAPLFGGVSSAVADGEDAVVLSWFAAADETLPEEIEYLIFVATASGGQSLDAPTATVVGETTYRLSGLTSGTTYYFLVRARDGEGQVECNTAELAATPEAVSGCIDFATQVQTIFTNRCITCHSGPNAPRGLHLDSYDGVIAGGATGNEVVACQPDSSLLFMKISMNTPPVGQRMPLGGPYLAGSQIETIRLWIEQGARTSCAAPDLCSDATPPTFAGLTSAALADDSTARLCWAAGSDDVTAPANLLYDIYSATSPRGQNYAAPPTATTSPGATCFDHSGLTPNQEYCWVVRARDGAGNRDANTVERCLTTPAASCIDYATVIQPIFNAECIHCHSGPGAPQGLHLDTYAGVLAGGATGNEVVACQPDSSLLYAKISQATPPVGVRMPADGPPYLSDAQIAAIQQWISEGARSSCAAPDVCSDAVPPQFAGLTSASALNPATARLCWSPASDDATPAQNLLYDVYQGPSPGSQNFAGPPQVTSTPGASCVNVPALSPTSDYCWVVRARDAAGNRDSNTVERCLRMPAVPAGCIEYDELIQPLLTRNCTRCHSGVRPPQWLRLDSYDSVIAGSVRRYEVEACDAAGSLIIDKISASPSLGDRMPRDGPPYLTTAQIAMMAQWINDGARRTCLEASTCGDTTPPSFAGASSATPINSTKIRVCWSPGTDNLTPTASLRYDLYEATASGGQSFAQAPQQTVTGSSCSDVAAGPGTNLCFVVRARDLVGNRDSNRREVCATTPAAACAVDYDPMVQPILSARCTHCHAPGVPPRFLDLSSYAGILAGGALRQEVIGCNWSSSLLQRKTGAAVCGNRMPWDGPPWLAPSERSVLAAWVNSGARQSCSDPPVCSDSQAPVFAGASSATALDATTIEVCWPAATDNTTRADAIVYELYESLSRGGQSFAAPASYAVAGGATCTEVTAATATQACFVVRARDLAGNRDGNRTEVCATTPGACFAYDDVIQPLFDQRCVHCHSGPNAPRGIRWDSYVNAVSNTREVEPCNARGSKLNDAVDGCRMPRDTMSDMCSTTACLTPSQRQLLWQWVDGGADASCPWGGC